MNGLRDSLRRRMDPSPETPASDARPRITDADYVTRARGLIERAIRRRWADGLITKDSDGVFTAFLGAGEIERLMRPTTAAEPVTIVEDYAYDPGSPLGKLVANLGLAPSEADLIALLLACEVDPASSRLVAYLGGNQQQFAMTIDLTYEIVYRLRDTRQAVTAALLHRDLAPHRRLRRLRYIVLDGADSRVTLAQGLRLHPRLTAWLVGGESLDAELTAHARLFAPRDPLGEVDAEQLKRVTAALQSPERLLMVDGPARSGRELLLRFGAARCGRELLVVGGRGLGAERVVAAFREASLRGALLAFTEASELLSAEPLLRLRECLDVVEDTVSLIGSGESSTAVAGLRPLVNVAVTVPPHTERQRMWRTYLGDDTALEEKQVKEIAALYNLGIAGIIQASSNARDTATFEGRKLNRRDVALAVRNLFDSDLSTVAQRAEVNQSWEDVVLPEDLAESVEHIIDRIRWRNDVLGDWGFARKMGKGLGITVLFSGEPGTGKSMVAGLVARELGLDLYMIDLARVTSKWLGETEKNLGRAFDAAEAGHVLLLFDEADSILGKRSEVKSSNDRYANLETNFILTRLEQFSGIAIFTTNLAQAVDPAVSRRMSAHVKFTFPEIEQRVELWRRMIPKETPLDEEIDFNELASQFELSGGFIRNVVLRAAYLAIREGKGLTMDILGRAARQEYSERGSLLVGGRLV